MKKSKHNSRTEQSRGSSRAKKKAGARVESNRAGQSENHVASFFHYLPGFAWMKDLEGRYVYANSALQDLKACRDGCIGKTDAELWPRDIAEAYRANDQKVIAERKPLEILEPYLVNG